MKDEFTIDLVVSCRDKPTSDLILKVQGQFMTMTNSTYDVALNLKVGALIATKSVNDISIVSNIYFTSSNFNIQDAGTF